jgi:hypothetical protein
MTRERGDLRHYDQRPDRDQPGVQAYRASSGRTPKINKDAGRGHWGHTFSILMTCGGMRMGQIIAHSSERSESVVDRPVTSRHVAAAVNHHLGIDSGDLQFQTSSRGANHPAGAPVRSPPSRPHQTAVSRDGRLMDSSPGVTFLRPIGADKMPGACRKPSRYITYHARLMGLGDRIDVFFRALSDVSSRLGGGD